MFFSVRDTRINNVIKAAEITVALSRYLHKFSYIMLPKPHISKGNEIISIFNILKLPLNTIKDFVLFLVFTLLKQYGDET